eukprot:Clim_evm6s163 gene=Clim_evmTU6s163
MADQDSGMVRRISSRRQLEIQQEKERVYKFRVWTGMIIFSMGVLLVILLYPILAGVCSNCRSDNLTVSPVMIDQAALNAFDDCYDGSISCQDLFAILVIGFPVLAVGLGYAAYGCNTHKREQLEQQRAAALAAFQEAMKKH